MIANESATNDLYRAHFPERTFLLDELHCAPIGRESATNDLYRAHFPEGTFLLDELELEGGQI